MFRTGRIAPEVASRRRGCVRRGCPAMNARRRGRAGRRAPDGRRAREPVSKERLADAAAAERARGMGGGAARHPPADGQAFMAGSIGANPKAEVAGGARSRHRLLHAMADAVGGEGPYLTATSRRALPVW